MNNLEKGEGKRSGGCENYYDRKIMKNNFQNRYDDDDDEDEYTEDSWGRYRYYYGDPLIPKKCSIKEIVFLIVMVTTCIVFTIKYNDVATEFFPKILECVTTNVEINIFNVTKSWSEEGIEYTMKNVKTYETWHRFYCKDYPEYKMRRLLFRTNNESIFYEELKTISDSLKINDTVKGCSRSLGSYHHRVNYPQRLLYRRSQENCKISGDGWMLYLFFWFAFMFLIGMIFWRLWIHRSRIVRSICKK